MGTTKGNWTVSIGVRRAGGRAPQNRPALAESPVAPMQEIRNPAEPYLRTPLHGVVSLFSPDFFQFLILLRKYLNFLPEVGGKRGRLTHHHMGAHVYM